MERENSNGSQIAPSLDRSRDFVSREGSPTPHDSQDPEVCLLAGEAQKFNSGTRSGVCERVEIWGLNVSSGQEQRNRHMEDILRITNDSDSAGDEYFGINSGNITSSVYQRTLDKEDEERWIRWKGSRHQGANL